MNCLYFSENRSWVGERGVPQDAITACEVPAVEDPRWIQGNPKWIPELMDVPVLTLSPFYPSGRLGACVEMQSSKPPIMKPNYPSFAGCMAWMKLESLRLEARPISIEKAMEQRVAEHELDEHIKNALAKKKTNLDSRKKPGY